MNRKMGGIEKVSLILLIFLILGYLKWWLAELTIDVPTEDVSFSYILEHTADSHQNDALPMLVALHGNGDTPLNFYETALDQLNTNVRIILIEGPISHNSGSAWPKTATEFSQYGKALKEAIELLVLKYPTMAKPVLLGFSGGAMMAYYQAARYGNSYSTIFPISGQLSQEQLGDNPFEPGARVFAYHGKQDSVISIDGARNAKRILQNNYIAMSLVEFEGGHHGLFTNMKSGITQNIEQKIEALMLHKQ